MTGALLERPMSPRAEHAAAGGRVTLEELLNAALRIARAEGSAECPLCHERMRPVGEALACGGCGSRLS